MSTREHGKGVRDSLLESRVKNSGCIGGKRACRGTTHIRGGLYTKRETGGGGEGGGGGREGGRKGPTYPVEIPDEHLDDVAFAPCRESHHDQHQLSAHRPVPQPLRLPIAGVLLQSTHLKGRTKETGEREGRRRESWRERGGGGGRQRGRQTRQEDRQELKCVMPQGVHQFFRGPCINCFRTL